MEKIWKVFFLLYLFGSQFVVSQVYEYGIPSRQPVGEYFDGKLPSLQPGPTGSWTTVDAFPNLSMTDPADPTFAFEPVYLTGAPLSNQLYVCDKKGKIWYFDNEPNVSEKSLFLDISSRVKITPNAGMGTLAFHPDFGLKGSPNRGYVYLHYYWSPDASQLGPKNQAPDALDEKALSGFWRLSRFTVPDGQETVDPESEYILIQQYDPHHWHNGGSIFFDNEGLLYLSSGDIGADKNYYKAGQTLREGLFGTVLRIDVDKDETRSHPIRRQPTDHDFARKTKPSSWTEKSYTQGYYIPNDNPWLDEDGELLEEFWCLGIRSPHRMSYDPVTEHIWVGDVGQFKKEELNFIVKGGNYQWPYKDGTLTGFDRKPGSLIGTDQPPAYEYSHTSHGAAVVGGYVYRGFEHRADLFGKYLFAEHQGGQIWVLDRPESGGKPKVEKLTQIPGCGFHNGPSSFGQDNDGELYVCVLKRNSKEQAIDGAIVKLSRTEATTNPEAPALLSETGIFSDLSNRAPASQLVPYKPAAPFWSDTAIKSRYLAIPTMQLISFSEKDNWDFPKGSVFVKHFDYPVDDRNSSITQPIETRLMVHGEDGRYFGFTYRWNEEGTDAELLTESASRDIGVTSADGSTRMEKWYYPSRAECMHCHTSAAGHVLGVRTHQLNSPFTYTNGVTDNQLRTFSHLELFTVSLFEDDFAGYPACAPIDDLSAPLDQRVRSYLDSNCSQCHQPGGVYAGFDARYTTPLAEQGLVNGGLIRDYGIDGQSVIKPRDVTKSILHRRLHSVGEEMMPPLAKNRADTEALRVLSEWIHSMDPAQFSTEAAAQPGPPAAMSDISKVWTGGTVSVDVLTNDFDIDGDIAPETLEIVDQPKTGSVAVDPETHTLIYTHEGEGPDSFTYRVSDATSAQSNIARVVMEIRPRSEFPQPEPEPEPEPEVVVEEPASPQEPATLEPAVLEEDETVIAASAIGAQPKKPIMSLLIPLAVMLLLILGAVGLKLAKKF